MAEPILKWAGGKRQLLDELYARFPATYGRYHEPFLGGGAVFFDLEPPDATVNDANPRLVNFYERVRDDPEALIERLESFADPDAEPDSALPYAEETARGRDVESYYYQQRARFNRRPYEGEFDPLEEAALLLYLNRTCYNGLYRENADGGFNVPVGRYANPDWVQRDRIRRASDALADSTVRNDDFAYVLDAADPGDLVYFDPPYEPMSATASFNEYSAEGFDREDQRRLLDVAAELDEAGVWVVLSNSGVMYEPYAEAGFRVDREGATRAINSDAGNRDEVDEIVATNVPPAERREAGQRDLAEF
ncbi:DNA adenine methylase [Halorubrum saccharovorum DSM 1137]|uniref:site-specific DNA-methyltransferase (adenine-specific) n=1 Tax=Halorubrum saccharovorum DSM 1137 TaxID=1227484 RepID=M0E3V4_9EURY|nr:Dam family site-specific DNA-(adenine-N6)-methyltransferase [Halorubrum saccharovorum]ELZ42460.1 DNA adenine methylase [Halorubrum saccharovorum DSM 1137]